MAFWLQVFIAVCGFITTCAVLYVVVRSGANAGLKESNGILRDQVRDYKEELQRLKDDHKLELDRVNASHIETVRELGELRGKFEQAMSEKSKLETLILKSLETYWQENPKLATEVSTTVHTEKTVTTTPSQRPIAAGNQSRRATDGL